MSSNGQNIDGFSTAVSGLNAQQSKLELVGNNIANINTIGYKSKRMTFAEQFGSTIGISFTPFKQAGFQTTGNVTDLGINGNSFFILNKNDKQSMQWIKDAILREAPDVPTIVIKAIGSNYEEVTDRDAVGVFLPQVKFVKAYTGKTKQNWVVELVSGDESVKLGMSIRSSSGGKLKQWSLKVTYNGLLK